MCSTLAERKSVQQGLWHRSLWACLDVQLYCMLIGSVSQYSCRYTTCSGNKRDIIEASNAKLRTNVRREFSPRFRLLNMKSGNFFISPNFWYKWYDCRLNCVIYTERWPQWQGRVAVWCINQRVKIPLTDVVVCTSLINFINIHAMLWYTGGGIW